jgi:hypothetical protein
MHPPIQSTKSYYRRQPLQQIQQTTKEITNTAPALNENNNSEDCDSVLVKQIRSLKLSSNTTTVTSTRASGVSLANIVAGNYPKQQQQQQQQQQALRNNENYSSRVKYYNNSQSQENIQPVAARGRPTSSKYVRNGGGMSHNVNFNNMNMNGSNRYKSNNNGYSNGSNRRHALNNNSELINKDDLRYTAKYWTSTTTTSTTTTTNTTTAPTVSIQRTLLI